MEAFARIKVSNVPPVHIASFLVLKVIAFTKDITMHAQWIHSVLQIFVIPQRPLVMVIV